jgi:type IV secretory pathway protease TraF
MIAFMRTRYVVAFYLVIFGSIIVAAYKMGLVHEKLRVVDPKPLGSLDAISATPVNSGSTAVVEVRERKPQSAEVSPSEPQIPAPAVPSDQE